MTELALSIGTNLGDRLENLRQARSRILALPDTRLDASSPVYETEPVDVPAAFKTLPFLNAVLIINSTRPVEDLFADLKRIETSMGRPTGGERNGPRVIDLDIVYAAGVTCSSPALTIPHPRWAERRFVVQPLADVRPNAGVEGQTLPVREILISLPEKPAVALFKRVW